MRSPYKILGTLIALIVPTFVLGYLTGINETYNKFSTGGCWVEKDTSDIVCIAYTE